MAGLRRIYLFSHPFLAFGVTPAHAPFLQRHHFLPLFVLKDGRRKGCSRTSLLYFTHFCLPAILPLLPLAFSTTNFCPFLIKFLLFYIPCDISIFLLAFVLCDIGSMLDMVYFPLSVVLVGIFSLDLFK